ncbi:MULTISPECIES: DUF6292 family protein [unclassified Amycolatopsis]|uniref:DUF6292 family protein n=1 Tax=unclassified Amycolatopsis TaxID=2618356 RepID=UPI001C69BB5B|nr:DUF6292 family protein [Amycolatopsis sp. DSM 110486]QYN21146.1 hypothetical protein K1T34_00760 [Amycolatopsis sp. DSM 110486]
MIPLQTAIDDDHGLRCGLTGYLSAVSAAVGVGVESCTVDLDDPVSAYVALDVRLRRRPGRDTALVWDERYGWSFAMETHSGEDLLVLAYFGDEVVPDPVAVRRFVAGVRSADAVPAPVPPEVGGERGELVARLLRYRLDNSSAGVLILRWAG